MFNRVVLPVLSALTLAPLVAIAHPSPVMAQEAIPTITTVLPENTAAVLTVNTSLQDWEAVKQYQMFPEIASLVQMALAFAPPEFKIQPEWYAEIEAVRGWLGDRVAIALLPTGASNPERMESNFVILVPIKDRDRFTTYLAKARQTITEKATERQYHGVEILEWQVPGSGAPLTNAEPTDPSTAPTAPSPEPATKSLAKSPLMWWQQLKAIKPQPAPVPSGDSPDAPPEVPAKKLIVGLLPDAILVSDQAQAIERLIDQQQASELGQNPQFQRSLSHPQYQRSLVSFYVNLVEAIKFADFLMTEETPAPESSPAEASDAEPNASEPGATDPPGMPSPPSMREEMEAKLKRVTDKYSSFDALVWTQPEGIRTQSNTYYQKPQAENTATNVPVTTKIFTRLPAITYLAGNGYNLKQQWQIVVEAFNQEADLKDALRELRNAIRLNVGLDLERDILAWMDGDYATFFFPSKRGLLSLAMPNLDLGMAFVVQTSNRAAAEIALERLNRSVRVKSNGELTVATRTIQGVPVTSWEIKEQGTVQSVFAYSWLDDNTLALTTGLGSMADLAPKPYLNLQDNYTFQTATGNLPKPNQGYVYVNMGAALTFIYGLLPYDDYPGVKEFKQVIGTIRSVSATSLVTPEKEQVDSLIVLAPARQPAAAVEKP